MSAAGQLPIHSPPSPAERPVDRRFRLRGIPWQTYVSLREADDSPGLRMTYDRGELELMSPSPEHEDLKTTLARLIGEIGLDAAKVMALGAEPRWAAMKDADTKAALDRGVFGAPSYVIGDEIFWGQDRLDFVARRLARM